MAEALKLAQEMLGFEDRVRPGAGPDQRREQMFRGRWQRIGAGRVRSVHRKGRANFHRRACLSLSYARREDDGEGNPAAQTGYRRHRACRLSVWRREREEMSAEDDALLRPTPPEMKS